jgi:hypothetical protein
MACSRLTNVSFNSGKFMGITGDRYVGTYEGHSIELIRNNWNKTLKLLIDGQEVASESIVLPHNVRLTATLLHDGISHTIIAKSVVKFPFTKDTIEIDEQIISLAKIR